MTKIKKGYRAFPPYIGHPAKAIFLSEIEFNQIQKDKREEAPSACPGHLRTVIWYAGEKGYIIQIQLENKPDIFGFSLCTFTPTFGMDQIDEVFAQDLEEYILFRELGYKTDRLAIFQGNDSIPIQEYLLKRGVIKKD